MKVRIDKDCKLVDLERLFIEKAREVVDLGEREKLVRRVFREVIGVEPFYVGTKEDHCNQCKRVMARYVIGYFHGLDDIEWIFIGEGEDGKYYANFMEFVVMEIDPRLYQYEEWWVHQTFDEYYKDMPVVEFCKDVEKYGLIWRIIVRLGLYKSS
jgi:hypothetical protein